ncbi:MAG: hypothetical protein WKF77_07495 [Planctomycetaceae bacterium]
MLSIGVGVISSSACLYGVCLKHYHYTDTIKVNIGGGVLICKYWVQEKMCKDTFTEEADEGDPYEVNSYQIDYQTADGQYCQNLCVANQFPQDAASFIPYQLLSQGQNAYVYCAPD